MFRFILACLLVGLSYGERPIFYGGSPYDIYMGKSCNDAKPDTRSAEVTQVEYRHTTGCIYYSFKDVENLQEQCFTATKDDCSEVTIKGSNCVDRSCSSKESLFENKYSGTDGKNWFIDATSDECLEYTTVEPEADKGTTGATWSTAIRNGGFLEIIKKVIPATCPLPYWIGSSKSYSSETCSDDKEERSIISNTYYAEYIGDGCMRYKVEGVEFPQEQCFTATKDDCSEVTIKGSNCVDESCSSKESSFENKYSGIDGKNWFIDATSDECLEYTTVKPEADKGTTGASWSTAIRNGGFLEIIKNVIPATCPLPYWIGSFTAYSVFTSCSDSNSKPTSGGSVIYRAEFTTGRVEDTTGCIAYSAEGNEYPDQQCLSFPTDNCSEPTIKGYACEDASCSLKLRKFEWENKFSGLDLTTECTDWTTVSPTAGITGATWSNANSQDGFLDVFEKALPAKCRRSKPQPDPKPAPGKPAPGKPAPGSGHLIAPSCIVSLLLVQVAVAVV